MSFIDKLKDLFKDAAEFCRKQWDKLKNIISNDPTTQGFMSFVTTVFWAYILIALFETILPVLVGFAAILLSFMIIGWAINFNSNDNNTVTA